MVANIDEMRPKMEEYVNDIINVLEEEGEAGWKRLEEERGDLTTPIKILDQRTNETYEYKAESLLLEAARRGLPKSLDLLVKAGRLLNPIIQKV